jgi:hypothetical protein
MIKLNQNSQDNQRKVFFLFSLMFYKKRRWFFSDEEEEFSLFDLDFFCNTAMNNHTLAR